ncbi:hypothetical protein Phab24_id041 [Acinetobacter phage Phab24]|nr:hypothetical protein Phab24_id041 [Acinetobacter phage Phab24]
MKVYVAVCFTENEDTNSFTDFEDVIGVYILKNHAEESARNYMDKLLEHTGVHSTYQVFVKEI